MEILKRKEVCEQLGRKMRIGVYGGSFNPVTVSHTAVARYVMDRTGLLDEVWFMPCYGHMYGKKLVSAEHRLEMCRIAVSIHDGLSVFPYEIDHQLSGATYQTLKLLLNDERYDYVEVHLIIGTDCANDFNSWVDFDQLNRLAKFIVVPRKGVKPNALSRRFFGPPHVYLDSDSYGFPESCVTSSTAVREKIKSWLSENSHYPPFDVMREQLFEPVYEYIIEHKLYVLDGE